MCCGDWKKRNVLGNVKNQTIVKIWKGKRLNHYRKLLVEGKADLIDACKNCAVVDSFKWKKVKKKPKK